jgi:hypothetical protein
MKKILLFLVLLFITTMTMSQIKISTSGNVGIGTNTTTNGKLQIAYNSSEFAFHASNKSDGKAYFGAHNANGDPWINFYHPREGYNKVRFKQSILSSDSTLKTEITLLGNTTALLKQIKTYSYYFKSDSIEIRSDSIDLRKIDYGVLAQEIRSILPDLVDTCNSEMFVNYNAFIAILIKGFNEQQAVIEQHQNQILILQNIATSQALDLVELWQSFEIWQKYVYGCCGGPNPKGGMSIPDAAADPQGMAILYQNAPNPFSVNTEISYYLPDPTQHAVIYIYNLQGAELKSFSVTQHGLNTITLNGTELPAGMYFYTFVVGNEIIDTKRMILTK